MAKIINIQDFKRASRGGDDEQLRYFDVLPRLMAIKLANEVKGLFRVREIDPEQLGGGDPIHVDAFKNLRALGWVSLFVPESQFANARVMAVSHVGAQMAEMMEAVINKPDGPRPS